MAQRVWRRQDDHRAARPPDSPLRHRGNRQRQLALQKPRRRSRNPRSPRLRNPGQLRRGERYRQAPSPKGVKIGRRCGVKFERRLTADSGYCSESNLEALEAHGVDGYVAPGRAKHPTAANGKIGGPLTQRMRKKIDDGGFETPYRLRKQVVEPVFGQIKQARGFRQFLLRGVEKVRAEWAMICTTHNLLKLFTLANAASAG